MDTFDPELLPANPRILLIKLRSIGDVIYNTAVYGPLKKRWPRAHLTVVVEPPAYDIVKDHPAVDEVLCFKKGSPLEQLRFYCRLFADRYDAAIDMHEGPRGSGMCFLSRARFRIGNKRAKRSFLYNVRLTFDDLQPKYPIDYQVALIRKMGVEFGEVAPAVHISEAGVKRGGDILSQNGIAPGDPFCVIHPGVRKIYDQWQFDKFAALADYFHSRYGLKIVLACGPGQEDQARAVLGLVRDAPCAFIQTGLQELAAITRRARFVLCHNGGYMHLAAAMGTPTVALFGTANPAVWGPWGQGHAVLYKSLYCSPCDSRTRRKECDSGDAECKRLIAPEDVVKEVEAVLARG
ncbi:MAG: glycosyltransferase family 9 protein [Nitrospinae bacterium]|nr:glycosyltransferase family 9 protein [Nitrospinota bacterium]